MEREVSELIIIIINISFELSSIHPQLIASGAAQIPISATLKLGKRQIINKGIKRQIINKEINKIG